MVASSASNDDHPIDVGQEVAFARGLSAITMIAAIEAIALASFVLFLYTKIPVLKVCLLSPPHFLYHSLFATSLAMSLFLRLSIISVPRSLYLV